MKKQILCAIFCTVAVILSLRCGVSAEAIDGKVDLTPEDADFLVRSVAAEYGEMSYAARVGVVSVILNRMAAEAYPDTAAGVISTYRNADGGMRFNKKSLRASDRALRMTQDAYFSVMNGGDITDGALNFEFVESPRKKLDFDFDDHGEDEYAREMQVRSKKYKLVTDDVGFW